LIAFIKWRVVANEAVAELVWALLFVEDSLKLMEGVSGLRIEQMASGEQYFTCGSLQRCYILGAMGGLFTRCEEFV
jgi:hypothetical protein